MNEREDSTKTGPFVVTYVILSISLLALGFLGYLGFLLYQQSILSRYASLSLLLVAVAAGMASFFSPCAFSLLPAWLAYYPTGEPRGRRQAITSGLFAALGVFAFLAILGILIALFGQVFFSSVTSGSSASAWIRGVMGVVLVILGAVQVGGSLPGAAFFHRLASWTRVLSAKRRTPGDMFWYGFAYTLAGIG